MADNPRKWLTAADCAARTGLTVRALRVYEREGLLKPSRTANGWRRYGPDDLMRLNTISVLKALGLTLAQIRKLLHDTAPSLLGVLQVQAKSWRERHGEAAKALGLVEAAIHRLERNQQPSLEELCELVNALQERSTPMQERATLIADLTKELLTTEEQWQWQTWWAGHSEDLNQNTLYLRERLQPLAAMQDLLQLGLSPGDPAVQEQVLKQLAMLNRYGVRERTVRMMDWNLAVTTRFMELGVIARERHPDKNVLPFPLMGAQLSQFYEQAMAASAPAQAAGAVIKSAQPLVEAGENPSSSAVDTIVNKLTVVCAEHGLGDPEVYLRFTPFMCCVNHQPLPPLAERTYGFLVQALRLRTKEKAALPPTVTVPALRFTAAELSAVRRAYARQIGLMAGVIDPGVEAAFAVVERENFMGQGPWSVASILRGTSMITPDESPAHLYGDNVVSLIPSKRLNNGASARDPASAAALAEALKRGGQRGVTRLYRGESLPQENCWLRGDNWCLALA